MFTELDRVNAEYEWFETLLEAVEEGRTSEATESIKVAMKELKALRRFLREEQPIDQMPEINFASGFSPTEDASGRKRLAEKLEQYLRAANSRAKPFTEC
jgi:hypothetical protein